MRRMQAKELTKRYALFVISLFFSALGVAFTKIGELGVSPVSSVPNVLNIKFSFISMGNFLIIWNCVLIVLQILILGRKFPLIQLLQFPLSFLFGYFTDFGMFLVSFIPITNYFSRLLMVFIGVVVLGFGVSLSFIADVIMNAGEGFVKAVSEVTRFETGNIKIVFDVSSVLLSVILSLIFFNFSVIGTREGTVIAAFGTGIVVKFFLKLLKEPVTKILTK